MFSNFAKFVVGESAETDEQLISRRLEDLANGKDVEDAVAEIEPLAKTYVKEIGETGIPALLFQLEQHKQDIEMVESILNILLVLIRDDSELAKQNCDRILHEANAMNAICQCFLLSKLSVRLHALTIVANLARLDLGLVQQICTDESQVLDYVLDLEGDESDIIRKKLYDLVPVIVKGSQHMQQVMAFRLMDSVTAKLKEDPNLMMPVLHALIEGHSANQKMFVGMGHLADLVPGVEQVNEKALRFLIMLFSSHDAAQYRANVVKDGLWDAAVAKVRNGPLVLTLIGWFLRGSQVVCAKFTEGNPSVLETVLSIAISSNDDAERSAAIFCIECSLVESKSGAEALAVVLCLTMAKESMDILQNAKTNRTSACSLLSIGCNCLLANHDTLSVFLDNSFEDEASFMSYVVRLLVEESDANILVDSFQFVAAALWESRTACVMLIKSLVEIPMQKGQNGLVFLLSMCKGNPDVHVTQMAALVILEALLFKDMEEPVFNQLIITLQTGQVKVSDLTALVLDYQQLLLSKEQTMWTEFAQELIRSIRKNVETILEDKVIETESSQIAVLKQSNEKLESENTRLSEENQKQREEIEKLKIDLDEHERGIESFNNLLTTQEQALAAKEEEIAMLNEEVARLKSSFAGGGGDGNAELQKQYDELMEMFQQNDTELHEQIQSLKDEISKLKESGQSDDLQDVLDENERLTQQVQSLLEEQKSLKDQLNELATTKADMETVESELVQAMEKIDKLEQELADAKSGGSPDMVNEIADLKKQLEAKDVEIKEMTDLIDEMSQEPKTAGSTEDTGALHSRIAELQQDLDAMQDLLQESERDADEKQKKIDSLTDELADAVESAENTLKEVREELNGKVAAKDAQISELEKAISEKMAELASLQNDNAQSNIDLQTETEKKDSEIQTIKGLIEEKEQELLEAKGMLDDLNQKKEQLLADQGEMQSEIETLKSQLLTLRQSQGEHEQRQQDYIDLQERVKELTDKVQELADRNERLQEQLEHEIEAHKETRQQLEDEKVTAAKYQNEKQETEAELQNLKLEIDAQKQRHTELEQQLDLTSAQSGQLAALSEEHSCLKAQLESSESNLKKLQGQIEKLQEERRESVVMLRERDDEIENLKAVQNEVNEYAQQKDEEVTSLQKELDALRHGSKAGNGETEQVLQSKVSDLESMNEHLRLELERLTSQIQDAGDALDEPRTDTKLALVNKQLHSQLDELQSTNLGLGTELEEVRSSLADVIMEREHLKEQLSSTTSKCTALSKEVHKLQQKLSPSKAELRAHERRITELMTENVELQERVKALSMKADTATDHEEIQRLKDKLKSAREHSRKAKALAAEAVGATGRLQKRIENQRYKNMELSDRVMTLEQELEDLKSDRETMEERHHAALRLIGELWTRNQSLVQRSSVSRLNTSH